MHLIIKQAIYVPHFGQFLSLTRQHGSHSLTAVALLNFLLQLPLLNLSLREQLFLLLGQRILLLHELLMETAEAGEAVHYVQQIEALVLYHGVDLCSEDQRLVL